MRYRSVVTFERVNGKGGDPMVVRGEIVASSADEAARRAVFRALSDATRIKFDSIVIVLDVLGADVEASPPAGGDHAIPAVQATAG